MAGELTTRWQGAQVELDDTGAIVSYELEYIVKGFSDEEEAAEFAWEKVPREKAGLPLQGITFGGTRIGVVGFVVTAIYKNKDGHDDADFSFDTSGGTTHILQSLEKPKKYISDGPDPDKFIGWNGQWGPAAEFAGVDKITALPKESFSRSIRYEEMTNKYKRTLAEITGTVNRYTFNGWEAGEVLCSGITGTGKARKGEIIKLTFNFMISLNESRVMVGGTRIRKKGWEYLWMIPGSRKDGNKLYIEPLGIYVSEIYREENFKELGLGL